MNAKSILTGTAIAAALSAPASAQTECIAYEPLRQVLIENGIRLEGFGTIPMAGTDGQIEIWVAPNGDWAILAINEIGIACIAISGAGWTIPEAL
jgi:hypothetical protein